MNPEKDGGTTGALHPAASNLLKFFEYKHLPESLQGISKPCADLAWAMFGNVGNNAEFTAGLRKLLEAKDCFVRSRLQHEREKDGVE